MTQQSSLQRETYETKDQATDQFNKVAGDTEDFVEHGREASERLQEVAGNFKGALDRSLREQPIATLVFAGILGFFLGALWKS